MDSYFNKLFILLQEAQAEDELAPIEVHDNDAEESQANYHSFSHFVKPDMLMNIYSLVDYWINEICEYHKRKQNLSLGSRDIKGKHELQARHKYLTAYAGLNLSTVQASYKQLDDLRKVRNTFMHGGGHVPSNREAEFSAINGILLSGSLIVIEDSFIWSSLEHAKTYLQAAVQG
ncbi:MAG: hypothetical protein ABIT70_07130 [Sulfuriferula sp.]